MPCTRQWATTRTRSSATIGAANVDLSLGAHVNAARTLIDIGRLHGARGRHGRAVRCLERAAGDLEAATDIAGAVRALLAIAAVRRRRGLRDKALSVVHRCHELTGAHPDSTSRSAIWDELAALSEQDGHLAVARAYHALSQRERTVSGDREGQAHSLRQLAWVALLQSRPGEAAAFILTAWRWTRRTYPHDSMTARMSPDDAAAAAFHLASNQGRSTSTRTARRGAPCRAWLCT